MAFLPLFAEIPFSTDADRNANELKCLGSQKCSNRYSLIQKKLNRTGLFDSIRA